MKVEPIKELKHIKNIKKMLKVNLRDSLLFNMGINSGLRVQDILRLRVGEVFHLKLGESISIREKKTGKENIIIINKEIKAALDSYLSSGKHLNGDFLFKSRKGRNEPLTTFRVTRLVKLWTEAVGLKGNFGAHSLRKTWCYHQRKTFGVSWELLAKRLNHASPSITRRYLGIQDDEVEEILLHSI